MVISWPSHRAPLFLQELSVRLVQYHAVSLQQSKAQTPRDLTYVLPHLNMSHVFLARLLLKSSESTHVFTRMTVFPLSH